MGYGSKSSDLKEGASLGAGLHQNIFLKEAKAFITEPNKKEETFDVLDFNFVNKKGDRFQYRIFNPEVGKNAGDPDKLAKDQKDAADKAVYVVSKVTGKDVEVPDDVESWEDFTKFIISQLPENYNTIPLEMILIGNVYNGKANIQAPNVVNGGFIGGGWLRRMDAKDKLTLSDTHKKEIAKYEEFIRKGGATSSAPKAGGAATPAADDEAVF